MDLATLLGTVTSILGQGRSNSTMKWALLWGLVDAAPRLLPAGGTDGEGDGTDAELLVSLLPVARSALRAIGPQLRPYAPLGATLAQTNTWTGRRPPRLYSEDVAPEEAAWILARWPVPRLHSRGVAADQTLWEVPHAWVRHITGPTTRNKPLPPDLVPRDAAGLPAVRSTASVLRGLVQLAPLLAPLVEIRWRDEIRTRNRDLRRADVDTGLDAFLFPSPTRTGWTAAQRAALLDVHGPRCAWCGQALRPRAVHVDHVLPWSRTRLECVENLALACPACNGLKSDYLPGDELLTRWITELGGTGEELARRASDLGLYSDAPGWLAWLGALSAAPSGRGLFKVVGGTPRVVTSPGAGARTGIDMAWASRQLHIAVGVAHLTPAGDAPTPPP